MIQKSRKLQSLRKRILQLLVQHFGYEYRDMRRSKSSCFGIGSWDLDGSSMLADMNRINLGEARHHTGAPCFEMVTLTQEIEDPEARLLHYFELLFCGQEFSMQRVRQGQHQPDDIDAQYGTVQFVDWQCPERNSYTVYEGRPGVLDDGVAWDLIIALNHIPVAAVMLAPTTPGHRPCQEAYEQMRQQLDADPMLSTYVMFCIISDGQHLLVGGPSDLDRWFLPWHVPAEVSQAAADQYQISDPCLLPIYALLRPEALCDYLGGFVVPTSSDRGAVRFCAQSHQYYAVQAIMRHMSDSHGPCLVVIPDADDVSRPTPTGSSKTTILQLMFDVYSMRYFDPEDVNSDVKVTVLYTSEADTRQPTDTVIYSPISPLISPLA